MKLVPIVAVLAPLGLLAACGGGAEDDERTASGEVLEGTISDSMLPLETVRSQPPLAKTTGVPDAGGSPAASPSAEATDGGEGGETPAPDDSAPPDVDPDA
jgi:hypothetical protein